jgi:phage shock protein E
MKQLILIIGLAAVSCSSSVNASSDNSIPALQNTGIAKDISVNEFKNLINSDAIVLDVRRKVEFESGHLKGAINIDWFDDKFLEEISKLDKSKTLLIHCASGGRSSNAMSKLKSYGFKAVYNMVGGFSAWKQAGYDYEK